MTISNFFNTLPEDTQKMMLREWLLGPFIIRMKMYRTNQDNQRKMADICRKNKKNPVAAAKIMRQCFKIHFKASFFDNAENRDIADAICMIANNCVNENMVPKKDNLRTKLIAKQKNKCPFSGLVLKPNDPVDHINGLGAGGSNDENNLHCITSECNSIKGCLYIQPL